MQAVVKIFAISTLAILAGFAAAQWTGPFAPDSRLIYNTGPVYVGGILDTSRFNIAESASGTRIIGLHSYVGTPSNNERTTALWGETNNPKGRGLQGFNFASADSGDIGNPATGVWAETASVTGQGIRARATATTGASFAGYFDNASSGPGTGLGGSQAAVQGVLTATNPASGSAGAGVAGLTNSQNAFTYGVMGYHAGTGIGVFGVSYHAGGYAVCGATNNGQAGHFIGDVVVTGTLSKGGGSFKIDHPLDPENKFLYHSFVESPDMMNIYNGVVNTDASGDATITMPDWFESLNQDFRYQLTIIDEAESGWAMAKVVSRIKDNRFSIRTNLPNQTVSWQVTGVRHDAWANQNRIPVEVAKSKSERGLYLHPAAFNLPGNRGIDYGILYPMANSSAPGAAGSNSVKAPAHVNTPANAPSVQIPLSNTPPLVPAVQGGR